MLAWSTTDPAVQRVNLFEPRGVSKLRFGLTPRHPLATLRARNGSLIEAVTPPQPAGTTTVGVVFSPNGAEEDYTFYRPLNYTYCALRRFACAAIAIASRNAQFAVCHAPRAFHTASHARRAACHGQTRR